MSKTHVLDTPETVAFKKAAVNLSAFLDEKGIKLSHAVALEALSKSLDVRTWRTLRAKLQQPAAETSTHQAPEAATSECAEYSVMAVYKDNRQLYGDLVELSTPLEAAIYVQLERLSDAGTTTAVDIEDVQDSKSGKSLMGISTLDSLSLESMKTVLLAVCDLAEPAIGEPPARGVADAEAWDYKRTAVDFWRAVAKSKEFETELQALIEDPDFSDEDSGEDTNFCNFRGELEPVNVADLLETLLELAKTGKDLDVRDADDAKRSRTFHLVQLKLVFDMYASRFCAALAGYDVFDSED